MTRSSASDSLTFLLLMVLLALAGYTGYGVYSTPEIASASPTLVQPGEVLTLRGARFATSARDVAVLFDNQSGNVKWATADEIQVEVPEIAGRGPSTTRLAVRVVVGSRVSAPLHVTLTGEAAAVAPAPAATPSPPVSPPPAIEPPASPSPTPAAVAARPTASPTPAPGPRAADLLAEARSAAARREFDAAVSAYERALAVEPGSQDARAGLAAAQTAAASLRRSFVVGTTQTAGRQARGEIRDFDAREVAVMKPPEVPARLECEVSPSRLKAGDAYSVKVYLTNDGTKGIKVASLTVATTVNGSRTAAEATKPAQEASPRGRILVHQQQGVWGEGVTSWSLEIELRSSRGDSYRNRVTWR